MQMNQSSIAVFRLQSCASESALIKLRQFDGDTDYNGLRLCAMHPLEQKLMLLNHDQLLFMDLEHGKTIRRFSPLF